jgi:hypothetical protein
VLWPRSRFQGISDNGATIATIWDSSPLWWEWSGNLWPMGVRVRKHFTGVTRDAFGNRLGNCQVQLFNTATGTLVDTQTSDSQGNYNCGDPNNVTCFLVGYLSGSPDVAGTTVDTLTGT